MKHRLKRGGLMLISAFSLIAGYACSKKEAALTESTETSRSTVHTIDERYFLESIPVPHSPEQDYWLGQYGSEKKTWIGSSDADRGQSNPLTLEQALERAKEIIRYL